MKLLRKFRQWGGISLLLSLTGVAVANRVDGEALHAEIPVLQQQWPCVTALRVDFDSLIAAAGKDWKFEADSVAVQTMDGQQRLPIRVQEEHGVHRVLVQMPAAEKKADIGLLKTFHLQFGPGVVTQAEPSSLTENLVWNGGFDLLDKGGWPEGLHPTVRTGDYSLVEGSDGGNALALNSTTEKGIRFLTPWVQIPEGSTLEYSLRYRSQGAKAHHYKIVAYGYVNFLDREGKRLQRHSFLSSHVENSEGWQEQRFTLTLPSEAAATNLEFNSGSSVPGSVILDEVKIVPINPPEVMKVHSQDGGNFSLMAQAPNIFRFDLGTANSPVMDGFLPLTPESQFSDEKDWGFQRLSRVVAKDKKRPDALARDYLAAARARFQIRLPKGEYRVWTLSGDSQADGVVMNFFFNQKMSINGQEVFSDSTAPAEVFRCFDLPNYQHFWLPGMDYHDTFTAPRFQERQFDARVDKDFLRLEWENLPLCAVIIYPADKQNELEGELAWLRKRRRREAQVRIDPGPQEVACKASFAERRRGFILFRRADSDPVYPSSRPSEEERIDKLDTFAAPDQTAALHFSLYPLRDLGTVQVQAGDLAASGRRIPATQIDVRLVRYIFQRTGEGAFQVSPFLLDDRDQVPVDEETCWTWYCLIRVPENTPPGIYKGELRLLAAEQQKVLQKIPVQLQVLPFQLEDLPIVQGYYYFPSEPWYATFWGANVLGASKLRDDPEVMRIIEENEHRELRFMKSLGLNSASFGDDIRGDMKMVDGEGRFNENNRFSWWMDIYAAEGMGKMPFYGFQSIGAGRLSWLDRQNQALQEEFSPEWGRAYRGVVKHGIELQKKRQWPEILWYLSDELSNYRETGAKRGVELGKLLRQVPEATSIASMNGPWEHIMVPHVDISMPNIAFPITPETLELLREHDSKLWLYNCGTQRMTLGLYPWRVKAGGRFQWHYRQQGGEQWDDGTGRGSSKYAISFNSPKGVIPALGAQTVREAIYDHRYMVTLEKAIAEARKLPAEKRGGKLGQCLRQAEEFVAFMTSRVPVDVREVIGFRVDPRAAGAALGGEFRDTDNLDRCRWSMALLTKELLEEIKHAQN